MILNMYHYAVRRRGIKLTKGRTAILEGSEGSSLKQFSLEEEEHCLLWKENAIFLYVLDEENSRCQNCFIPVGSCVMSCKNLQKATLNGQSPYSQTLVIKYITPLPSARFRKVYYHQNVFSCNI
jgi:hypothetical protein